MPYQALIPGLSFVRGTHYTPGSDFFYFLRCSNDTSAGIYRMPITQAVQIAEGTGVAVTPGKQFNLNAFTSLDLQWVAASGLVPARLRALFGARLVPLVGFASMDAITADTLLSVNWDSVANNNSVSEAGTSTTGNFYAVRIPGSAGELNYAKVRIYNDGAIRLDWVAYILSPNPVRVSTLAGNWHDLVVSDYDTSLYVSGEDTSGNQCVVRLEKTTAGPYPQYDSALATTLTTQLVEPRQLVLDGGFVYVVDATSLWRIDPVAGDQVELVTGLVGSVGLLLHSTGAGLIAYISDTAGGVSVVNLSERGQDDPPLPAPTPLYSLGGESGFLSWASLERTAFYVTDRTAGRVLRVDVADGTLTEEATALTNPQGVEVISPSELYVASEGEIGVIRNQIAASTDVLMGIGLVPFGYINESANTSLISDVLAQLPAGLNDGKANTSTASGYYFWQHPNIPFGGSLSLQLNHEEAWAAGYRYYRVSLHNVGGSSRVLSESYVNLRWNGLGFVPETIATSNNRYPFRNPDDLWYNPFLSVIIPTTVADNGHNVLRVELFTSSNSAEHPSEVEERLVFIDNTRYNTTLWFPRLGVGGAAPVAGAYPSLDCGCIGYDNAGSGKNTLVEVDFAAWHPQGVGQYSLRFFRGNTHLPTLDQVGQVTTASSTLVKSTSPLTPLRVGHLIGSCNIANIQIHLSVASRVIDGFGWVNLSSVSTRSFTLAPTSAMGNTAWADPG